MTRSGLVLLLIFVGVACERPKSCCELGIEAAELAWLYKHKAARCAGEPVPERTPRFDILAPEWR